MSKAFWVGAGMRLLLFLVVAAMVITVFVFAVLIALFVLIAAVFVAAILSVFLVLIVLHLDSPFSVERGDCSIDCDEKIPF